MTNTQRLSSHGVITAKLTIEKSERGMKPTRPLRRLVDDADSFLRSCCAQPMFAGTAATVSETLSLINKSPTRP